MPQSQQVGSQYGYFESNSVGRVNSKPRSRVGPQQLRFASREEMTMDIEHYRFQLGRYDCVSLYDGFHDYKLEQMFTNVPRPDVEIALQAQGFSQKAVTTPFTFLYVNTGKHRILVDIGAGDLLPTTGKLLQNMLNAGITPESIDSIFITHD